MEALSPFTRRIVALGLLVLVVVSALNLLLVPGWGLFQASLARLGDARFQRIQTEAVAARPLPRGGATVPVSLHIVAPSASEAGRQLAETVRSTASSLGLSVAQVGPAPDDPRTPGIVAVDLGVEGKEVAIIQLIARLEQDRPLARLTKWHMLPGAAAKGTLRLDGRLVAAWGPR